MTSTNEMTEIEVLKAKAKELGISGWQTFKDPVKLQARIDEVGEVGTVRKSPPKMSVSRRGRNREETIALLEREDPQSKYLTKSASTSHEELLANGFEVMKKPNGETMFLGNDIICRTDKESYYECQNADTEDSLKAMRSIDKDLEVGRGGKRIQALKERPKQGEDSE